MAEMQTQKTTAVCRMADLVAGSGVAVKLDDKQIALFYLPGESPQIYAIDNFDPIGEANVLSRGIVGDLKGELVVASPLYKQHFSLMTGQCQEDPALAVQTFAADIVDNQVVISL